MDRYEYKIRLQEISRLIDERRFEEAAAIADEIDWARVRNTQTLCKIGDLYKINREYEKSRRVMSLANARDPQDPNIVYRLAELTIYLYGKGELQNDLTSALRLSQNYQELDPENPKKYILQYKLFDVMHTSAQERVQVLRTLKQEEYSGRWGYELAKVLKEAGQIEEAKDECRSVMTRFPGKFADKAKALLESMKESGEELIAGDSNATLEAAEEIVRKSMQEATAAEEYAKEHRDEVDALVHAEEEQESKQTEGTNLYQFRQGTHPIARRASRIESSAAEAASAEVATSQKEEISPAEPVENEKPVKEAVNHEDRDAEKITGDHPAEQSTEPAAVDIRMPGANTSSETEGERQMSIGQVMDEWEKIRRNVRRNNDQKRAQKIMADTGNLLQAFDEISQHGLLEDIEKGVARQQRSDRLYGREQDRYERRGGYERESRNENTGRYNEAHYAEERYEEAPYEEAPRYEEEVYEAPRYEEASYEEAPHYEEEAYEAPRYEEQPYEEDPRYSEEHDESEGAIAKQSGEDNTFGSTDIAVSFDTAPEVETDEAGYPATRRWNAHAVRQAMMAEKARMAELEAAEADKLSRAVEEAKNAPEPEYQALRAGETSAVRSDELEQIRAAMQANAKQPEEDETEAAEEEAVTASAKEQLEQTEYTESAEEEAAAYEEEAVEEADYEETSAEEESDEDTYAEDASEETLEEEELYREEQDDESENSDDAEIPEDEFSEEAAEEDSEDENTEDLVREDAKRQAKGRARRAGRDADEQKAERSSLRRTAPPKRQNAPTERVLTEDERKLFGPICVVRENCQQILNAIEKISLASYTGNLIISGSEGATRKVAQGLLEITKRGDGNFTGKIAKATASGLNRLGKDKLVRTLQKIENGALIVEEATGLKRDTLSILRDELEGRERGLIVILMDNRKAIQSFVKENGQYLNSFDIRIDIKALNDKALVSYGIEYAMARDYSIDEFGQLALSSRISRMQTRDHHVTTKEVREIVDEAISYASKKSFRTLIEIITRKRYDADDRIIIHEKDFMHET